MRNGESAASLPQALRHPLFQSGRLLSSTSPPSSSRSAGSLSSRRCSSRRPRASDGDAVPAAGPCGPDPTRKWRGRGLLLDCRRADPAGPLGRLRSRFAGARRRGGRYPGRLEAPCSAPATAGPARRPRSTERRLRNDPTRSCRHGVVLTWSRVLVITRLVPDSFSLRPLVSDPEIRLPCTPLLTFTSSSLDTKY